jgi:phage terminase large subunit-like protein
MSVLMVPPLDEVAWPTLGPQVCDWIESFLVHGPGDIRGEPARIDDETRGLIFRMYEVYPKGTKIGGRDVSGRRRFTRCGISLRKGTAKTEKAAWIIGAELHPDAPVRCDGFDAKGEPVGVGVRDPYIPLVAYTEEQTEELAYAALKFILEASPLVDDFDIGLERIMRKAGDGKAVALASSPSARDGARTTFQHFDETHHFHSQRLRDAHQAMLANIPKRMLADAWTLETTTAFTPGQNSVAEGTMDYAKQIESGEIDDPRLFYFHRSASAGYDIEKEDDVRQAILEASGPAAAWSNIESIVDLWRNPQTDRAYFERVWLNRPVQSELQAFDVDRFKELEAGGKPEPGTLITLGFDGSRTNDATAIVGTVVETGHQFVVGVWERPPRFEEWSVPRDEVDEVMADAMETWDVWRLYADPPYWEDAVDDWAGRYGEPKVFRWYTDSYRKMALACRAYRDAILNGEISHDGNKAFIRHIGNARKHELNREDDEGRPLFYIKKERKDSPKKIDIAMAAILSKEAQGDAKSKGAHKTKRKRAAFL